MFIKNKIITLLGIFGLSFSMLTFASEPQFQLEMFEATDQKVLINGNLTNLSSGNYQSTLSQELDDYLVTTHVQVSVSEKELEACTEQSWERYDCGDCQNGMRVCAVRKRPGVACLGDQADITNFETCNSVDLPECRADSWESYNCSYCMNGLKNCQFRKKWGVSCQGETGKPSEIQVCDNTDLPYCDSSSWESYDCSPCSNGTKTCQVKKRWGVFSGNTKGI